MSNTTKNSTPSKTKSRSTSSAESGTSDIPSDATTVYVGVDASWRGLAVQAITKDAPGEPETVLIKSNLEDFSCPAERLDYMGREFMRVLERLSCPPLRDGTRIELPYIDRGLPLSIWYEGYSFATKTKAIMTGELGGHLRWLMWQAGYDVNLVPPTKLKQYVTKKGQSKKNLMLAHIFKNWGYMAEDDDQGDAYALARLGLDAAGVKKTKVLQGILDKCEFVGGRVVAVIGPGEHEYSALGLKVVK